MTLLHDILKWTESLPMWQRHAARCLFEREVGLSDDDYSDLFNILKSAHGIQSAKNIDPVPLAPAHLPASATLGGTLVLTGMRNLKNVNKIAAGQNLKFGAKGLTIVYGQNGSGKSGYSRVMKRACRARDQGEDVLPDASDATARGKIPEAVFDVEVDGTATTVAWKANSSSSEALSSIAVFDSHCARAYVTQEQEVAYLPYGLDVVESLANKVIPEVGRMLAEEIASISVDRQPFAHLLGETLVGETVAALSEKTKPEQLKSLAALSADELTRHSDVVTALAEADPSAKAKTACIATDRMKNLAERLRRCALWCSDGAVAKLRELHTSAIVAADAEKAAAIIFRSGETLLAGTGDEVWKNMFEAAQRYSTEVAYPDHPFPHTGDEARCPLCQQALEDGAERLQRFAKFIKDDVAKTAAAERQKVLTAKAKIAAAALDLGFDQALADEVDGLQGGLSKQIKDFTASTLARRDWMLRVLDNGDWTSAPPEAPSPRRSVRNMAARFLREARTLEKASSETKRKALQKELIELNARQSLAKSLDAVIALLDRLRKVKALEGCRKDLDTRAISNQSKLFASNAVTQTLRGALNAEFKALGIGHVQAVLKERASRGKTLHQLVLNLPTSAKLDAVLSEGEQRAIALGSFLAELGLANHKGGIVLDDPVSSLDHRRRGRVAKRLVAESCNRQVLVFTHEVVFLYQLQDECQKVGIEPFVSFLESGGGTHGHVSEGLPWAHKSFGERIDALEKRQKYFEKLPWPSDPPESLAGDMIRQYSFLRATIERVVQDLVLNGTVQRFRDYIDVNRLKQVVGISQCEVDEIFRLNQRCHDIVEAHDPSSAKDEPPPTADEFRQDIGALKTLITRINDRRNPPKKPS